jgi:Rps23 Pro-64 3,4-dihydroxylase Tpa1-like proline 4-hydroxylase
MKAGDFLKPHNDDNRNRSLALVIYLSADWAPHFGGALNVVDGEGRTTKIEAEYNSMVVFDVAADTRHFVDPIPQDNFARVTIGGWYHKPA